MNEVVLTLNRFPPLHLLTKRLAYVLLAITYFILPISSSIKSITLTAFLMLALFTPAYRLAACRLFQTPWMKGVCFFLCVIMLDCLWGPASMKGKWVSFEKYMKLLYLPFLVVMFRHLSAREMAIKIALAGISFVSMLSILAYFQFLSLNSDAVFRNHIVFGFMGAYGAYMAACLACARFQQGGKGFGQWGYALLAFLLAFQVAWVNGGRMAYLLLLILALLWAWQCFSKKQLLIACVLVCAGLITAYQFSPTMHSRIDWTKTEIAEYRQEKLDSSLGLRVQMHRFAKQLFLAHPVFGNGTGSFLALSDEQLKLPGFEGRLRDPHSQYWLIAAEQGSVGLIAFFGLFSCFFFATYQLKQTGILATGLLIAFGLSQLTDSMLFYSGPGCFFMMIMAIYLGEAHENSI
jgi:O-antigen ligase